MPEPLTALIPVFYACLPDAPGSPPFEVAWGRQARSPDETRGLVSECRLLRPPAAWAPELSRDPSALRAYGLSLGDLRDFGTSAREVAARMNAALAGQELFSATVADDDRLKQIFEAARAEPKFALRRCDAEELIAELARLRRLTPVAIARAQRGAEVKFLTGTRAEAKARYLATYWGLIAGTD